MKKFTSVGLAIVLFLATFTLAGLAVVGRLEKGHELSEKVSSGKFDTPEFHKKMAEKRKSFRQRERLRHDRLRALSESFMKKTPSSDTEKKADS